MKSDTKLAAGFGLLGLGAIVLNVALFVGACLIVKVIFF